MLCHRESVNFSERNVRVIRGASRVGEEELPEDSNYHSYDDEDQTCCKWSHIIKII
jgi:hypothetical protein